MAIIYPKHLTGTTAGAFRQVKKYGATTAGGGYILETNVYNFATETTIYLKPNEPLGGYMTALKSASEDAKERSRVDSKNTLENYVFSLNTSMSDNSLTEKMTK